MNGNHSGQRQIMALTFGCQIAVLQEESKMETKEVSITEISQRIYMLRGHRVILDTDLAQWNYYRNF